MVTWNNKLVTFLSGVNVIAFYSKHDFEEFKEVVASIGLDCSKYDFIEMRNYYRMQYKALRKPFKLDSPLLVSYRNNKGFGFDIDPVVAEDWFGIAPFTWEEIKQELAE